MRRSEDRGETVVEANFTVSEVIEVMNAVHHTRVFGGIKRSSSAILDAGFQELVISTARALLAHPEAGTEALSIRSLSGPSDEEVEKALKTLEESVENAKKRPPVEEPKDEAERLHREEAWERMATRPIKLVMDELKRLRSEGLDDDSNGLGPGVES